MEHGKVANRKELNDFLESNYNRAFRGKGSYDDYAWNLQAAKENDPEVFGQIQDRNTQDINKVLNTLAFEMDQWNRDPISNAGLRDLEYNVKVPMGFGDRLIDGNTLGMYSKRDDKVTIPGWSANDLELPTTLRHEGQHKAWQSEGSLRKTSEQLNREEQDTRRMDNLYARANKMDIANADYDDQQMDYESLRRYMPKAAQYVGGTQGSKELPTNVRNMSPKQIFNILNTANQYKL